MNEAETRAEYIDPKLKASGWGEVEGSKILREFRITDGKIQGGGGRGKKEIADYVLVYRHRKIGVIEAKARDLAVTEGVAQAKSYAEKLQVEYTYSTNGSEIYEMSLVSGEESAVADFPTPDELWNKTFSDYNQWKQTFDSVGFSDGGSGKRPRYYQENAINNALNAIAEEKTRVLLTLATGTGKTFIASQIAWKLFQSRYTLKRDGARRPRILFLADRNILANQAMNNFSFFEEDALVRIEPADIRKKGAVPTSGSVFFTIFQTFMSGVNNKPYFGDYPSDFFDCIIIDECHRGGANDESTWRGILDYFSPAIQIGLTATPKRKDNVDTYKYFGDPVYVYSLKEGVNDGFLTPFKVKRIQTTIDEYVYTSDDDVIEGDVEDGRIYEEDDFARGDIQIVAREKYRVKLMLDEINQNEKTIIFCANQGHALLVRDLVNQLKQSKDPNYCVRVTANDGARGEQFLRDFQDNEKTIPTILTTSQKLSTGVDARNIRNIVLMRPVKSMIEFKQIIGRGTRLFDGKEYFTLYDFVDAYHHFLDKAWDGDPAEITLNQAPSCEIKNEDATTSTVKEPKGNYAQGEAEKKQKLVVRLRDGKEREIQNMISTSFFGADGKPLSLQEFMENMFGALPDFFRNERELQTIWANPVTRKAFLEKMEVRGYGKENLEMLQKMLDAEKSDLLDVLLYISFLKKPLLRTDRVRSAKLKLSHLNYQQREFLDFVLGKYEESGVDELDESKLSTLLTLKYHSPVDALRVLGDTNEIRMIFFEMQENLYEDVSENISKSQKAFENKRW